VARRCGHATRRHPKETTRSGNTCKTKRYTSNTKRLQAATPGLRHLGKCTSTHIFLTHFGNENMRKYVTHVFAYNCAAEICRICVQYMRKYANINAYMRIYAKICGPHGNMRKCAPHVLRIFSVSQHAVSNGIADSLTKSCAKCAAHILDII